MADIELDASELLAVAAMLDNAEHTAAQKMFPVVKEYAGKLRNEWRDNAKLTAREHGKHYPNAITTEQVPQLGTAEWVVGPEAARPQGGMGRGFEYGGPNQPPHLDGARAAVKIEPEFIAAIDKITRDLL